MTCEMPSRWLRFTSSPATGSALAHEGCDDERAATGGWRSLVHEWIWGDGPVAAAAAGSVGIWVKDNTDAGHRFVEFRQVHRDVVRDECGGRADVDKARRVDVKALADVRGANFQEFDRVELKILAACVSRKRCSSTHRWTSAVGRVGELFFECRNLLLQLGTSPVWRTVLALIEGCESIPRSPSSPMSLSVLKYA